MMNLGDVPAGSILYVPFLTYNAAGASVTISGLAVTDIEIYKDGSTTQRASDNGYALLDTDGIDFDGITGLHGFSVDLSDNTTAGFYAQGSTYWLIVSAITVDGQTVSFGYYFTIDKANVLRPTTAGRTLDVSAGGEAGVDWANVGSPTTTLNLSGTTVKTATDVETDTADIQSRLPAALVSGRIDASVGAMAANVMTAAAAADDLTTELQSGLATAAAVSTLQTTANAIEADTQDIQGRIPAALVSGRMDSSVGAMGAGVLTATAIASDAITAAKLDADVTTELQSGLATAAALATVDDFLDTEIAAIKAKTDQLTFGVANELNVNVESINTAAVLGVGTSGDKWRGS